MTRPGERRERHQRHAIGATLERRNFGGRDVLFPNATEAWASLTDELEYSSAGSARRFVSAGRPDG